MKTYEELIKELFNTAEMCGIHVYNIKNKMEITTLEREFSFCCVPEGMNPPYSTRACIHFSWDSMMTAESIYGGNCSLYHGEEIECTHDELEKEPFTEIIIEYQFDVEAEFRTMTDEINSRLLSIFNKNMEHENIPIIKWEVIIRNDGENMITGISAEYYWEVNLLEDNDFMEVFEEVKGVLEDIQELPFIKKIF